MSQELILKNNLLEGQIELEFKNAKTLELENKIVKTNKITETFIEILKNYKYIKDYDLYDYNGHRIGYPYRIVLSDKKVVPDGNIKDINSKVTPNTLLTDYTFVSESTPYIKVKWRFNQPSSDRIINTIILTSRYEESWRGNYKVPVTCVSLNEPCSQTHSQILDVTYRIFLHFDNNDIDPNLKLSSHVTKRLFYKLLKNENLGFPNQLCSSHKNILTTLKDKVKLLRINYVLDDSWSFPTYYRIEFNRNLSKSDWIGAILKNLTIGRGYAISWDRLLPNDSQYKPIQPIHNHSNDAPTPFMNVDHLANGTGYPSINGDNWNPNNKHESFLYSININKTGNVGVSTYSFTKRLLNTGFEDNSYNHSRVVYSPVISGDIERSHGMSSRTHIKNMIFDEKRYIVASFDDTGVCLLNVLTLEIQRIDHEDFPNYNFEQVKQIAVDDNIDVNKGLYIADAIHGLYKVTNIMQSTPPIITHYNASHVDIPSNECYAVDIGFNNAICAVFKGSLCISTNGGTSFTQYNESTTPQFAISGITDDISHWSNVSYISLSKYHQDMRMLVKRSGNGNFAWWSLTTNAVDFSNGGGSSYKEISNIDGYWVGLYFQSGYKYIQKFKFGTTDRSSYIEIWNGFQHHTLMPLLTDYYGNKYIINGYDPSDHYADIQIFSLENKYYIDSINISVYDKASNPWYHRADPKNRFFLNNYFGIISNMREWGTYEFQLDPYRSSRSLRNNYSVMGETLHKYNYNPNINQFERNYYHHATDTSGHNRHAVRHNFDTASHFFTGRAMIDASSVFPTNTFDGVNNGLTFCCTYKPHGKLNKVYHSSVDFQEKNETLFELSLKEKKSSFRFLWNKDNKLSIREYLNNGSFTQHDITSTPANNNTYRIILTLLNDQVKVYLDGSLIGTKTISSPIFNLSKSGNVNDTLKFIIASSYWNSSTYHDQEITYSPTDFLRGELTNVQLWNTVFDQTDVTNDFSDINGVISSKDPSVYLQMRYQLTEDLIPLETKPTHSAAEELDDGLTISFSEGSGGDSYVATDYYTCGVLDGILKDNATQFDINNVDFYIYPADRNVTDLTDPLINNQNVELVKFNQVNKTFHKREGSIYGQYGSTDNTWSAGGKSSQTIKGDFELIFTKGNPSALGIVGLSSDLNNNDTIDKSNIQYGISFTDSSGSQDDPSKFHIFETADPQSGDNKFEIGEYLIKDKFKIKKVGTQITYYKYNYNTDNWDLIYTSTVASPTDQVLRVQVNNYSKYFGYSDIQLTYNIPTSDYIKCIGLKNNQDPSQSTGRYKDRFRVICNKNNVVKIDNVEANIAYTNDCYSNIPIPSASGEVVIHKQLGLIKFHPDDINKNIDSSCTCIYSFDI